MKGLHTAAIANSNAKGVKPLDCLPILSEEEQSENSITSPGMQEHHNTRFQKHYDMPQPYTF